MEKRMSHAPQKNKEEKSKVVKYVSERNWDFNHTRTLAGYTLKNGPTTQEYSIKLLGGQIFIWIEEFIAEWKNAQKKLKKNIISEIINNWKPNLKWKRTNLVWKRSYKPSWIISENQ